MYSTCIYMHAVSTVSTCMRDTCTCTVCITFNDTNSLHDNVTSVGYMKCRHSH